MTQKIVLPLVILLLASSVAVPFALYHHGDDGLTSGQASGSDTDQTAGLDTGNTGAGAERTDGVHTGPASSPASIARLLPHLRSSTAAEGTILPRLAPLLRAAPDTIEPITIDQPVPLKYAALTHPATGDADIAYVDSLPPLPEDLDLALGHVVAAHGIATQLMATEHPAAATLGAVTMAHALDQKLDTLNKYRNHPVWDQTPTISDPEPITFTLAVPPLTDGLLDLYGAMGFSPETVDALEPRVDTAVDQLPPTYRDALAPLVTATASYQHAVVDALPHLAGTASHEDPGQNASEAEQAMEEVRRAAGQARAAANEAYQVIANSPAGQTVGPGPWSDPLGLIVVGTPGDDTFDKTLGAEPETRATVTELANTTRNLLDQVAGDTNVTLGSLTLPTGGSGEGSYAHPNVTGEDTTPAPKPGWHMIVLDPGGDDVYHNNAGGINAGGVRVQVDAAEGSTGPLLVDTFVEDDGAFCVPPGIVCDDTVGLGPTLALFLGQHRTEAHYGVPTGLPMAAMVVDAGGNDTYLDTGEVIQGSARGLALGMLVDADGDDDYHGSELAQGASEAWGHAALIDLAGDDRYAAQNRSQAWVDVPDPTLSNDGPLFGTRAEGFGFQMMLARHAQGALLDAGGHDAYHLDDLLGGQGIVKVSMDGLRDLARVFAHPTSDELGASLVDIGGPEQLPVPVVELDDQEVRAEPSRVNVSGYEATHLWYTRDLDRAPAGGALQGGNCCGPGPEIRFKTAVHATTSGSPDAAGDDGIRLGKMNTTWNDVPSLPLFPLFLLNAAQTSQDLLLFGEPTEVQDPPLLTLTFGEDTVYNGTIARSGVPQEDGSEGSCVSINNGIFVTGDCLDALGVPTLQIPSVLVDLGGNDTYLGTNRTVGYAASGGLAMVIDQEGRDHVETLHESIGYAQDPGSVAAVIDLDGNLEATSGNRSQAHAREFTTQPKGVPAGLGPQASLPNGAGSLGPASQYVPPMALLDLGASESLEGSGAHLVSGHESQAYSKGTGLAVLVGSTRDDVYFSSGKGQAFHEGRQLINSACEFDQSTPTVDASPFVRGLRPWIGGAGLMLDPSGDEVYAVASQVGMADVDTEVDGCPGPGPELHVNILGLAGLIDVRGADKYHLAESPQRPGDLEARACSGDAGATCMPGEDRAWSVVEEDTTAPTTVGPQIQTFTSLGLGVDNIRNLHHALVSTCRGYEYRTAVSTGAGLSPNSAYTAAWDAISGNDEQGLTSEVPQEQKEKIPQCAGILLILGALTGDALESQRSVTVNVAEIEEQDAGDGEISVATAVEDASFLPRELLSALPSEAGTIGPLFTHDALIPGCQNADDARAMTPSAGHGLACLTVESEAPGTWPSQDPKQDTGDPGDTATCNCSAQLTISPRQGAPLYLSEVANAGQDLYPTEGTITTYSLFHGDWYRSDERLRATANAKLADNRVSADIPPSAAFPVNLSQLPQGLASIQLNVTVDDAYSEESGGIVPPADDSRHLPLIQARPVQDAFLQEDEDGWGLFLVSSGAVQEDRVGLTFNASALDQATQAFTDLDDWRVRGGLATAEPASTTVIDGPGATMATVTHGAPACATLILDNTTGSKAGTCWTGMELVMGFRLGDLTPQDLATLTDTVSFGEASFETEGITGNATAYTDAEAGPETLHATETTYQVYEPAPFGDLDPEDEDFPEANEYHYPGPKDPALETQGIPGTRIIEPGLAWASEFMKKEASGMWTRIDVIAGEGASMIVPAGLFEKGVTDTTVFLHEDNKADPVLKHGHLTEVETFSGAQAPTPQTVPCRLDTLADLTQLRAELPREGTITLDRGLCMVTVDPSENRVSYLLPMGPTTQATRLVTFQTETWSQQGEKVITNHTLHVDPNPPQGQISLDAGEGRTADVNVTFTAFADTLDDPRLRRNAETDLLRAGLEARASGDQWTEVTELDAQLTAQDPSTELQLDLSEFIPENSTEAVLEVRGFLEDTSGNRALTNPAPYQIDRQPPTMSGGQITTQDGISILTVTLDEAATPTCEDEGCTLTPARSVPGTDLDPVLDISGVSFGTRSLSVPATDLLAGVPYNLTLTLRDDLGNQARQSLEIQTGSDLKLDASAMAGTLVNKTATLNWSASTASSEPQQITTSAYLVAGNTSCPLLVGYPGVANPGDLQSREVGPLAVDCQLGHPSSEVTLLMYVLDPVSREITLDEVPITLDADDPEITLDTPQGWRTGTVTGHLQVNDTLPTEVVLTVDDRRLTGLGGNHTFTVAGEGTHDILVEATDLAGNTASQTATIQIDQTPPTISASLAGVREELVLVEVNGTDGLSGLSTLQLATSGGQAGPEVPALEGDSLLLSIAREQSDATVRILATDEAGNVAVQRLALPNATSVQGTGAVSELTAQPLGPDRMQVSFTTSKAVAPVLLVDSEAGHQERALARGTTHTTLFEGLGSGRPVQVTVALPTPSGTLAPTAKTTVELPQDRTPPSQITGLQADPRPGGVHLSWDRSEDDVGVSHTVLERDGQEIATVDGQRYLDERSDVALATYRVAAVDASGNQGPWTAVDATPLPDLRITDVTVRPSPVRPDEPVTVQATIETPAGLHPDVVTLKTWSSELTMDRVSRGNGTSLYAVRTMLPALNVTVEDPSLSIVAQAGELTRSQSVPAPLVSLAPATDLSTQPNQAPLPGVLALLVLAGAAALITRRWSQ